MFKKIGSVFSAVLLVLASTTNVIFVSSSVGATSIDDNVISVRSDLVIDNYMHGGNGQAVDVSATWLSQMHHYCGDSDYSSLTSAIATGSYLVLEYNNLDKSIEVVWQQSGGTASVQFYTAYDNNRYAKVAGGTIKMVRFSGNAAGTGCEHYTPTIKDVSSPNWIDGDQGIFVSTFPIIYPTGYAGNIIPNNIVVDSDGDGLSVAQELDQGTSDDIIDSDGDGLNDNIESQWYTNREAVFCKTSVTPHVCSYPHPTAKDVYVEIDWMHDGTNSFKPSDTQVGLVSDAFAAKGLYFHADTGQYGGGNQLSTYTASLDIPKGSGTDYFDYKDNNFSAGRQGIWRYMIAGNNYSADTTSSGVTYTGSDNIFVSYGLVKGGQMAFGYTDQDTALAGTILHEIGHSLCMSGSKKYSYQSTACVYDGVDSGNAYPDYISSLNYTRQMGMVDYSTGTNGSPGDHDDWSAVAGHMSDFTQWDYDTQHDYSPGASAKPQMAKGITIGIAQKLKAKGLLRPGKATWRHLKVNHKDVTAVTHRASTYGLATSGSFLGGVDE